MAEGEAERRLRGEAPGGEIGGEAPGGGSRGLAPPEGRSVAEGGTAEEFAEEGGGGYGVLGDGLE